MDERCEKTDLLIDQCGHCQVKRDSPEWEAMYDGSCGVCNRVIYAGTKVRWTSDGMAAQHSWH